MLANVQFQLHYAHKDEHINAYLAAITEVFTLLAGWVAEAIKFGEFKGEGANACHPELWKYVKGPELEYAGFQRLCK